MSEPAKTERPPCYCSFCGKSDKEVAALIAGPCVFICDECVDLCVEICAEMRAKKVKTETGKLLLAIKHMAAGLMAAQVALERAEKENGTPNSTPPAERSEAPS